MAVAQKSRRVRWVWAGRGFFGDKSPPAGLRRSGRTGLVRESGGLGNAGRAGGFGLVVAFSGTSPLLPGCVLPGRTGLVREGGGLGDGGGSGGLRLAGLAFRGRRVA